MAVLSARRRTLQNFVGVLHLLIGLVSQLVDAVSAVEGRPDLLISLNESLQFSGQVFVLSNQHVAVVLKRIDLSLDIPVLSLQLLVGVTEIALLAASNIQIVLSSSALTIKVVQSRGKHAVTSLLLLESL